jgi:hypothetical protein
MNALPTGTVTFLLTDVKGSTRPKDLPMRPRLSPDWCFRTATPALNAANRWHSMSHYELTAPFLKRASAIC